MSAAWQINVAEVTGSPQLTGTMITFRLQLQCSAITASSCNNSEVRIPAQDPTTFSTTLPVNQLPLVERFYFDDTTMEWVLDLVDVIPAGSSIEIDIDAFAPTNTTPDGTTFDVQATVDADNTDPATDSAPGSWSASADLSIAKYLQFGPDTDAILDMPVSYFLYPCSSGFTNSNEPGNLYVENWTVTDTLPDGVVFVSASPGGVYDAATNSVTWMGTDTLPLNSCEFMGASDFAVEVIFPSTVFGPAAVPQRLVATNEAVVTGFPVGAPQVPANELTDSDEISHGFGLPNPVGTHTKFANTQYFSNIDATFEDDQARYTVDIRTESASSVPYFFRLTDPLPCLDNNLTAGTALNQYESNDPGVVCANPAFQPDDFVEVVLSERYLSMTDANSFAASNPTLPLQYLATDGTTGILNLPLLAVGSSSGVLGPTVTYRMPWADIIAQLGMGIGLSELTFESRDVGLQVIVTPDDNRVALRMNLEGSVAPDTPTYPMQNQDRVRNYAHFFIDTDDGEIDLGFVQDDVIIYEERPALRTQKTVGESSGLITLTGISVGAPFSDQDSLIIADLLPAGYTFQRERQQFINICDGSWSWTTSNGDRSPDACTNLANISVRNFIEVEVIDDYNGTGRQLVRATFLPPPVADVWESLESFRFSFNVNQVPMRLAAVNEVRIYPTSDQSSQSLLCQRAFSSAPTAANSNDTNDWDGDGLTTGDAFCSTTDQIRTTANIVDISSFKAVRGDDPVGQDFQPFPAIAPITENGGTGAFQINMLNSGSVALTDLVIYDVLPFVGDVGLSETQVATPRGSDFAVTFVRINQSTLPAGAQVEYSFSNTPCRDELTTGTTPFPSGCVNDWTTTIPATDSALVRALRITFPGGDLQMFDPGEALSIDYEVTYPTGVSPGETAWNVFAYAGTRTDDNSSILPAEPPKVGIGIPLIDLNLNKSVSPSVAYVGEPLKYTITIDHAGNVTPDGNYMPPAGTATNVVISDDFIAQGLTIVPGSSSVINSTDNGDGGATFNENTGEILIPRIGPNDVYTICYFAFSSSEATITNTAEIEDHVEEDTDSTPGNGDVTEDDIDDVTASWVTPSIDLQKLVETSAGSGNYIEADASDGLMGSYLEGQPVNYRYVITNTGSVSLRNINLTDELLGTECDQTISFLAAGSSQTIDCTWPFGFQFSTDEIVNVANVSGTSTVGGVDSTVTDIDSATIATDIIFDLALTKTPVGAGPFTPGNDVLFTITVFNQGTNPAFDVDVADYFDPAELSQPQLDGTPAGVTDNGDGTFTIDEIAMGDQVSFTVSSTIAGGFAGTQIINNAEITGGSLTDGGLDIADVDSSPGNNANDPGETGSDDQILDADTGATIDDDVVEDDFDPAVIMVEQVFDLALYKVVDSTFLMPPYQIGDRLKFDIGIVSQGSIPATEVVISDILPPGLSFDDTDPDNAGWTANADGATLTIDPTATGVNTTSPGQPLGFFDTAVVSIYLEIINAGDLADPENFLNLAQIESGTYESLTTPGTFVTVTEDLDSDYGLGAGNDTGGGPGTPDDNETLDNQPGEDIDSQDPALVQVGNLTLGSTVFLDQNNNGMLDVGTDTGIPGVEVQLFTAGGVQILTNAAGVPVTDPLLAEPVLTDADGNYFFAGLSPGDYVVTLPTAPAAAPLSSNGTSTNPGFTEIDPDNGDVDNDDNGLQAGGSGTSVSSLPVTLEVGNEPINEPGQGGTQDVVPALGYFDDSGNMTVDFGFFAPVSVGDTAFVDVDMDGTQSVGDLPLAGVTVALLDSAGDTVRTDADGNAITGVTMTAADGSYSFANLPPGIYSVAFDISTTDDADFYTFTTANTGNDAIDSDNSLLVTDSTAQSDPTAFLNSGEADLTLDVGVVCAIDVMVAEPFTVCATGTIDLTTDASITPENLGGNWTTLEGSPGTFDDGAGVFGSATTYTPSPADVARGFVTLVLTTNAPPVSSGCAPVSASVRIEILQVDCGSFPWGGE